jgi:hypothetical protein
MKRPIITLAALAIRLTAMSGCETSQVNLSRDHAAQFFESYVDAVRSGDSTAALDHWSPVSRDREGVLTTVPFLGSGLLPFERFGEFLQNRTAEIGEIRRESDYHVVELNWVLSEGAAPDDWPERAEIRYYVGSVRGQPVLINPLDILTRDWQAYETDRFVFHYPRSISTDRFRFEMHHMDELSGAIASYLEIQPESKVSVYRALDASQCGQLIQQPPGYGYAVMAWNLIVTTSFVNPHEYVHLLTMEDGPFVNAAFSEGLAVALGGGAWFTREFSMYQARNLLDDSTYLPISQVMVMDDFAFLEQAEVTYHEAGAFVKYLLDRYGWESLSEFEGTHDQGQSVQAAFRQSFGSSLESEERQWIQYLRDLPLSQVDPHVPSVTESRFVLQDPVGDDHGDGLYRYPTDDRFRDGAFDLTHLGVSHDSSRVYFEIGLREVIEPVTDSTTGRTFFPAVTIAIRREPDGGSSSQRRCLNVRFENDQGYDLKIDVGRSVQLTDRYNRVRFSSGDLRKDATRHADGVISFSLPIELCGRPGDDWAVFAGVYLGNDVGTGFLRLIPWFLTPQSQPFNIGCGSDPQVKALYIDILVPEGRSQETILASYKTSASGQVEVPFINQIW